MPAVEVHAALGKPSGTADREDGLCQEWWHGERNGVQTVRVLLERGTAVKVSATSPAFRTAVGLSTAADPAAILPLGLRRSGYELRGSGGGFAYHYDDVERGLAWEITGTGIARARALRHLRRRRPRALAGGRRRRRPGGAEPGETCAPETPAAATDPRRQASYSDC
jgi:hypothetical protein